MKLTTARGTQHATGDSTSAAKTTLTAVDKALGRGMLPLAKAMFERMPVYEAKALLSNSKLSTPLLDQRLFREQAGLPQLVVERHV